MKTIARFLYRIAAILQDAAIVLDGGERIELKPVPTLTHVAMGK